MTTDDLECLSCGGVGATHVMNKGLSGGEELQLYRCRSCGLVFSRAWRTLANSEVYNYYADRMEWPEDRIYVDVNTSSLRKTLEGLGDLVGEKTLLDVGCGSGELVRVAVKEGWEAFGIDFSKPAIGLCHRFGLPCEAEDFFSPALDNRRWHVITMSEVIEHVPKPGSFLSRAQELLVPGGLLWVTTPNFSSLSRHLQGADWKAIGPDHISYFTTTTLKELIAKNSDLRVRTVTTKNISIQSITSRLPGIVRRRPASAERTDDGWSGSPTAAADYQLRQAMARYSSLQMAKRIVNGALNLSRLGDTIVVLMDKPDPATASDPNQQA